MALEQRWCDKCDGKTEHVSIVEKVTLTRTIDGDSMEFQRPLAMCLICWHKEPIEAL